MVTSEPHHPGREQDDDVPVRPAWDERILACLPPGVDLTQLREDLRLTPTQRIEKLQRLLEAFEALRPARP